MSSTFSFHSNVLWIPPAVLGCTMSNASRPLWGLHNCCTKDAQQIVPAAFDHTNHNTLAYCCVAQITAPWPTSLMSDINNASLCPDAHPLPHPLDMLDGKYLCPHSTTLYTMTICQASNNLFTPEANILLLLTHIQLPCSDFCWPVPLVVSVCIKEVEDHLQHQFPTAQDAFTTPHTTIEASAIKNCPSLWWTARSGHLKAKRSSVRWGEATVVFIM
jgi:hypothetical protein